MSNNNQTWYHAAFVDVFEKRLDNSYMEFFSERKEELGLARSRSVVSLGVGTGLVDTFLAAKCMPQVESYIGVEPSQGNCDAFLGNMRKACPELKVDAFCGTDDQYSGPPSKVDTVILSHVLYYCSDPIQTIKRASEWLLEDGVMVIMHSKPNQFWVNMAGNSLENWSYTSDSVLRDLDRLGMACDTMIPYLQYFDAVDPGKEMCDCIMNRESTEEEALAVKEYIGKTQIGGRLSAECMAFSLPKQGSKQA